MVARYPLAYLPGETPPAILQTSLRSALLGPLAQARATYPGVELSDDAFFAHLANKVEGEADVAEAALRVRVPELFLACACARRDAVAIALFEQHYFTEVTIACSRFGSLPITIDDVRQRVRERLFLATPPAIAGYAGRGDLRGWVRAAVLHLLLNISAREAREQPMDERFFDHVVDASTSAEAACVKEACRAEFKEAFMVALNHLSARERSLLRYAFVDGLNVDGIGAIFRVHRATAARWLAKARTRLVRETREELIACLGVDESEAASIVRGALSRIGSTLLERLR